MRAQFRAVVLLPVGDRPLTRERKSRTTEEIRVRWGWS